MNTILAPVRQSFQCKLFGCERLKHLHRTIDVSAEIWNHSVALKNRYYKLFGKGLPKAKLQETCRVGKWWEAKAFKRSPTGSTLAGKPSSEATSRGRRLSASGAST